MRNPCLQAAVASWLACSALATTVLADPPEAVEVEFSRDVQPILSDRCYACHGPDEHQREADLRLDLREDALAAGVGRRVIAPGEPGSSELIRRITATDPDVRMPPPDSGPALTADQVRTIERWIGQGAPWGEHWSLVPPRPPALPRTSNTTWPRNAVDHFILARIEQAGLAPSPPADRPTLLRRVTLDLTGLPPTPEEIDAFLADDAPDAYERAVDRLLHSPRYGEQMAAHWLDVARFADTSGYQTDGVRHMWRWRDWVIQAYNQNLPFDRFTIEQLAGDLLPDPTLDQLIATGFNRNHRTNSEGGIVFEEYLVEYAADRVDTTASVWLGLTMGCARCHDHKFDSITQREYYQFLAYFNNIPERGRVIKYGNDAPLMKAPTPRQRLVVEQLRRQRDSARQAFRQLRDQATTAQRRWERSLDSDGALDWTISPSLHAHYALDGDLADQSGGPGGQVRGGEPSFADGVHGQAARLDKQRFIQIDDFPSIDGFDRFTLATWVYFGDEKDAAIVALMDDDDSRDKGLCIQRAGGRIRVGFGPRWLDDAIVVQTQASLTPRRWYHLAITYDGSQAAGGLRIHVDGRAEHCDVLLDWFTGTFKTEYPLRLGSRGSDLYLQGRIDEVRYFTRQLRGWEISVLACTDSIDSIARLAPKQRGRIQRRKLNRYFLAVAAPAEIRDAYQRMLDTQAQWERYEASIPDTMVMSDRSPRRPTYVLQRGQYDRPGEPVPPGVPNCLPPLPGNTDGNRLALARWLVQPDHPLTSRVAVNRYWQYYFGQGLVRTPEDFGSQGQRPTHPELLDWLALEFQRRQWDVKWLQRLIVTSATYRQSSLLTPSLLADDPDNRLLARFPRLRLRAETIRDQALQVAGSLDTSIGGPSVKIYQPAGLWNEIASDTYQQDEGSLLYRRSMYTFWKRTVPPPSMTTFDAPSREACVLSRSRTNTPLQALALLNDTTYVEAARMLAVRIIREGGSTVDSRLRYGYRLVLGRWPMDEELEILRRGWQRNLQRFQAQPEAVMQLLTIGQHEPPEGIDSAELAAYAMTGSILLNLDETITRE